MHTFLDRSYVFEQELIFLSRDSFNLRYLRFLL